jgi:hypothetical protein
MRPAQRVRGVRRVHFYSELRSYLNDFVRGLYRFLWIVGRPGLGKSECVQAATTDKKVLYVKSGHVTALALYRECYEHVDQPIILDVDEVEIMPKDTDSRRLFLALGESRTVKELHWHTTSTRLGETPSSFVTSSPFCVVANQLPNNAAIASRATVLEFDPTNRQVHEYAATWFWNQQIFDFIGRHLNGLLPLDLRLYAQAYDDLRAHRDWRDLLLKGHARDLAEIIVQDLEDDPAYPTRSDKERRFAERMADRKGGGRSSYHAILARLRKAKRLEPETAPCLNVHGERPAVIAGYEEPEPAADIPQRDAFVRPIDGSSQQSEVKRGAGLDDRLGWERRDEEENE